MSIFADKNTRLLVQGITGSEGMFHTRKCIEYGTKVVAGVTPGKGGQKMDDERIELSCKYQCHSDRRCNLEAEHPEASFWRVMPCSARRSGSQVSSRPPGA